MNSLQHFPYDPTENKRTIQEIYGSLEVGTNEVLVFNEGVPYPMIDLSKKIVSKSSLTEHKTFDVFAEDVHDYWKRAFKLLIHKGSISSLQYLSSISIEENFSFLTKVVKTLATGILFLIQSILTIYFYFYPFEQLTDDELVENFSSGSNCQDLIRCFAWHPKLNKCAIGLSNNEIHVYSYDSKNSVILMHPIQKKLVKMVFNPNNPNLLIVACQSIILIWDVEKMSLGKYLRSQSVHIIKPSITTPITDITYHPSSEWLTVCGPRSSKIMLIKTGDKEEKKYLRSWFTGFTFLSYSPDNTRLFVGTTLQHVKIFELQNWSSKKWGSELNDFCQCCCWNKPDGTVLLFAPKNEPSVYVIAFYGKAKANDVGGFSKVCKKVLDLSEYVLPSGKKVGGRVQDMIWDQNGQRLIISFKDNPEYLALFRTSTKSVLEFTAVGFIHGLPGEKPILISFHENFKHGSLLTICWNNNVVSYIPLQYDPKKKAEELGSDNPRSLTSFCVYSSTKSQSTNNSIYLSRDSVLSPRKPTLFSKLSNTSAKILDE